MNSSYSNRSSSDFYPSSSIEKKPPAGLILAAIGALALIAVGLIFTASVSFIWKILLVAMVLSASVFAGMQASAIIKRIVEIQQQLAQAQSDQQLTKTYKPLLENYQP